MTYKVHLDGYNLVPYLTGQAEKSPRESFIYCNDDQQVTGLRFDNWKLVFMEQRARARCGSGPSRSPRCACRRSSTCELDPYERADITSNTYYDWLLDHVFLLVPAQDYVGKFLVTFKEYPQRQKAASFNLDEVMEKLKKRQQVRSRSLLARQCRAPCHGAPSRPSAESILEFGRRFHRVSGRTAGVATVFPTPTGSNSPGQGEALVSMPPRHRRSPQRGETKGGACAVVSAPTAALWCRVLWRPVGAFGWF